MTSGDPGAEVIRELSAPDHPWSDPVADPVLDAIPLAILLEDCLGVEILDTQLDAEVLRRPEAIAALLRGQADVRFGPPD